MWQIPSLSPQKRFWNVCMNSEHTVWLIRDAGKKWFSLLSSLAQTVIPPFSPLLSTEKSLTANLADKHSPFMKHLSVGSKLVNLVIWWKYIFTRHCNLNILYSCVSIPGCNLNISNFHQQQSRMWQISWWRPIHKESAGNQC